MQSTVTTFGSKYIFSSTSLSGCTSTGLLHTIYTDDQRSMLYMLKKGHLCRRFCFDWNSDLWTRLGELQVVSSVLFSMIRSYLRQGVCFAAAITSMRTKSIKSICGRENLLSTLQYSKKKPTQYYKTVRFLTSVWSCQCFHLNPWQFVFSYHFPIQANRGFCGCLHQIINTSIPNAQTPVRRT